MPEAEKNKKRKKWREEKRKQKDKKKSSEQAATKIASTKDSSARKSRVKRENYKDIYIAAQNRNIYLHRALETMRKRLYRLQKSKMQEKNKSEAELNRLKARNEILEASLKLTYRQCESSKERHVIKKIANNYLVKSSKAVIHFQKKNRPENTSSK
ncbi:unnamed protein product [Parnassius apollo]|uniref:(apollo) hypothetical protein n=1 Tax=Parnassius apollo TaxID=110799 RepID=A0A8S3WUB1_PARAO|nr:unnamed protein product [Parnassius apollo]